MSETISGINRTWDSKFRLSASQILEIVDVLNQHVSSYPSRVKLRFRLMRDNNFYFYSDSVDQIINEKNLPNNPISNIAFIIEEEEPKLSREPWDRDWIFLLEYGANIMEYSNDIRLYLRTSENNWNISLLSQITPIIERTLNKSYDNLMFYGIGFIGVCWAGWTILKMELLEKLIRESIIKGVDKIALLVFVYFLVMLMLRERKSFLNKIFYKSFFAWGEEAERIERLASRYRNFFITVSLGIISSIIASIVFNLFNR